MSHRDVSDMAIEAAESCRGTSHRANLYRRNGSQAEMVWAVARKYAAQLRCLDSLLHITYKIARRIK